MIKEFLEKVLIVKITIERERYFVQSFSGLQ